MVAPLATSCKNAAAAYMIEEVRLNFHMILHILHHQILFAAQNGVYNLSFTAHFVFLLCGCPLFTRPMQLILL